MRLYCQTTAGYLVINVTVNVGPDTKIYLQLVQLNKPNVLSVV